jgi:hypothetical protein
MVEEKICFSDRAVEEQRKALQTSLTFGFGQEITSETFIYFQSIARLSHLVETCFTIAEYVMSQNTQCSFRLFLPLVLLSNQ